VRDVRVAHAEACLASERLAIYEELGALANGLAEIAESRSSEGDASPADASAIRADAYIAIDQVAIARRDRVTAIARLQVLLGREAGDDLEVVAVRPLPAEAPEATDLLRIARAGRPDVRAAELELQSAAARAGWERTRIFNLAAQVDVQWDNSTIGARMGGVLELPIFNQNQGGVGRADAAIERSAHRVDAVRQQVTFEVVQARARLEQSLASLSLYERNIVPPLREALDAATLRYELGDDSYLIVLDALKRLRGAQLRHVELEAEVRRSRAELERAVGARLQIVPRREPAAAGSGT
jgi:cobalt-zinc-cadmium efflux system outer membrane protein